MFHTAQTDMASSTAQARATDAHHRAVLTVVLTGEEADASKTDGSAAMDQSGEGARPDADTQG